MLVPLRPEPAWERIERCLEPLPAVEVPRSHALGRVLARALAATVNVPAGDVAAMDGYALAGAPRDPDQPVPVTATIVAGSAPGAMLAPGTAVRIMTGAPLPSGADRVVPVELSNRGERQVRFSRDLAPGANIRRRSEILAAGDQLLAAGTVLGPGALALLASQGLDPIPIHGAPRVAVLTTGDEVVPPHQGPGPGQLRDSHTDFLLAAGRQSRLEFESLGIAPDRAEDLSPLLAAGLERDVLLVGGGVSMGELDLVEGALVGLGCEVLFHGVEIQPGRPLLAARHGGGWVFGLPGNPASVMVGYWLFVRPVLRRLMGMADHFWAGAVNAALAAPLPAGGPRDRFVPATLSSERGHLRALPHLPRGSHDLAAFAQGQALVRIPANAAAAAAGEMCEVLRVD
jgi:molybdopterin molybdotransferase